MNKPIKFSHSAICVKECNIIIDLGALTYMSMQI